MINWKLSLAAIAVVLSGQTQAALHDRGNGMIYDDVLNITWLQDANYAQTSGYDADGRMTWQESLDWAEQLDYQGFTKWRLATAGTDPFTHFDSSDEHWHLYNNNLNNLYINSGCYPDCFTNVSFIDATTGLTTNFLNIQTGWYWYKETYLTPVGQIEYETAWSFSYSEGGVKDPSFRTSSHYAWAVVDGDVGADTDYDGVLDLKDN